MAPNNKKDDDYRPDNLSKGQRFARFIWNPSTHEFLGRTGKSWFLITIFYIALYGFLAAFFSALLIIFYQTVDNHHPKWKLEESLIGASPGLGYRPMHPNPEITIISYTPKDEESIQLWSGEVKKLLESYDNTEGNVECDYGFIGNENKSCIFKVKLDSCHGSSGSYGFEDNKPCLFFKLNKIFDWKPEPYEKQEIEANSMEMPTELQKVILDLNNDIVINNNIWVSCAASEPHTNVTLKWDGHPGFPAYYYPYIHQNNYHSPLVVMQIHGMPTGSLVRINCRLWAKNILYDRQRRIGGATFEIQSN